MDWTLCNCENCLKFLCGCFFCSLRLEPEVSKADSEERDECEVGTARTGARKDRLKPTSVSPCPPVSSSDGGVGSTGEVGSLLMELKSIHPGVSEAEGVGPGAVTPQPGKPSVTTSAPRARHRPVRTWLLLHLRLLNPTQLSPVTWLTQHYAGKGILEAVPAILS